jgi:MFS family permease
MKSNAKKENDFDSPTLINYLRQDIPIEEIRDYSSSGRIASIDFVKGFAIIFIILAHYASVWLNQDWYFMYGLAFMFLDILGPSLFVFLSALSVVFTVKKKAGKMPEKLIRNRVFSRGLIIMAIGMLINVGVPNYDFPLNLWGWNILFFMGFSQIFSYYALKITKMPRAIIGIFGEYLYEAMNDKSENTYKGLFRIFFTWGIFLIITGVIMGFTLQTFNTMNKYEYGHIDLWRIANEQSFFYLPGMPDFLIRGTASNMLYNLGAALTIIAVAFYFIDLKGKLNNVVRMFNYYGKISLSLFIVHNIFMPLYFKQLNIFLFAVICVANIGLLGFLMYIWIEYGRGIGSPEWLMVQIGRIGQKTGENIKKTSQFAVEKTKKTIEKRRT